MKNSSGCGGVEKGNLWQLQTNTTRHKFHNTGADGTTTRADDNDDDATRAAILQTQHDNIVTLGISAVDIIREK